MRLHRLALAFAVSVASALAASEASALSVVRFLPESMEVLPGAPFDLYVLGDLSTPIVGFGLDVSFDPSRASQVGTPAIGPSWVAVFAADGDGLAGVAFPSGVAGFGVLLATLRLEPIALGPLQIEASITPGDLSEGFALAGAGFDDVVLQGITLQVVVPETSSLGLALLGVALASALRRRRCRSA
jgi:MYXO-CTERM domain-containing protein